MVKHSVASTEYLEIDLAAERWHCRRCGHDIGSARLPYKEKSVIEKVLEGKVFFLGPDPEIMESHNMIVTFLYREA